MVSLLARLRSGLPLATTVVLGLMTLTWLVKSILGFENDFLYHLFGWPYTLITGIIVGLFLETMIRAKTQPRPEHPTQHLLSKLVKLITLWIPVLFATGFVYSMRLIYDWEHGWWSRVFKNLFIILAMLGLCVFRTVTTIQYFRKKVVFTVTSDRWIHLLLQLSAFYGMVDAVTYSIFAADKFKNYGDTFHADSHSFYLLFMFGTVMNGMAWFRFSHEFYSLMHNHDCDLTIRHRDYGFKTQHPICWGLVLVLWLGVSTVQLYFRFLEQPRDYFQLDIPITLLSTLVTLIKIIRWLCYNSDQVMDHHPGFDHEHVYFGLACLIALVSSWYGVEEADWVKWWDVAANTLSLVVQVGMLMFSIPVHGFLRLFLLCYGVVQLVNAVWDEITHYDHTYQEYQAGEKLQTSFVVLTFLSWSLLETLMFIIEFHLAHLLSNKVNYENPDELLPLRGQHKITYHGHDDDYVSMDEEIGQPSPGSVPPSPGSLLPTPGAWSWSSSGSPPRRLPRKLPITRAHSAQLPPTHPHSLPSNLGRKISRARSEELPEDQV